MTNVREFNAGHGQRARSRERLGYGHWVWVLGNCLLLAAAARGADGLPRLRTLSGNALEGELAGVTEKHIQWRDKDNKVTEIPFAQVLDVELQTPPAQGTEPYIDVSLNDGTLLHCREFVLQGSQVTLKLTAGDEVKLPLAAVAYILRDAQDAANRQDWQRRLSQQGEHDLITVKKNGIINPLMGTLGAGDEKGERIEFELNGKKYPVQLKGIHGLSFYRKLEVHDDPVLCKVHDASHNVLMASKIAASKDGCTVTTVAGAVQIRLPAAQLVRLDFSKGKLTYLSDLHPIKVIENSNLGGFDHYRRDKNLDGGELCIPMKDTDHPSTFKPTKFPKGLALHAYTELVYDIGGEYKDFKAILGVDVQVGGEGTVKVVIEGDEKPLYSGEVSRKNKDGIPVALSIRNVKQLKIIVRSTGIFDLGCHVDIADAKVSK